MTENIQRVNILGIGISAINIPLALQVIDEWIGTRTAHYVCVTGVHGVMESQRDEELRLIHNRAGLVTPDGMPLVWMSHFYGYHSVNRVYGPDLMLAVCGRSVSKGYKHYFYGGGEGVPERLANKLTKRYPGLKVVGTFSPPYRELTPQEDEEVISMINQSYPDILWVGLSTPKQERWMANNVKRVNSMVMIGVGAAFDFHAGLKKQAPHWIQRRGLEWLFRLAVEPRRLWKRYAINNPQFVLLALGQILGFKRYTI